MLRTGRTLPVGTAVAVGYDGEPLAPPGPPSAVGRALFDGGVADTAGCMVSGGDAASGGAIHGGIFIPSGTR